MSATPTLHPVVSELSPEEANALLARNWIARIAYSWHDRVDVEPIHYVYDEPWIFGRTGVGAKLLALAHNQWCAVEVDEVDDLFDWRSVVVKGPFMAFNSALGESDKYDQAVAALRRLVPNALRDGDPTPDRSIVFGIHASEIAGRRMVSSG
ncbi:MAG TPA: pyridoxamine 5'-phosphate oxidase family protein [Gemmatimonadaceae bacterium]